MAQNFHGVAFWFGVVFLALGCSQSPGTFGNGLRDDPASRAKGARDAREYAATGKLKLKEYPPLPSPPQHGIYIQLLRERHQIEYEIPQLPKGMAENALIEQVRGWNGVMESEIGKKFGPGLLEKLRTEAEGMWRENVKKGGKAKPKPFS